VKYWEEALVVISEAVISEVVISEVASDLIVKEMDYAWW
jgi:hypothetical protein